jgi:hypothetical protein
LTKAMAGGAESRDASKTGTASVLRERSEGNR